MQARQRFALENKKRSGVKACLWTGMVWTLWRVLQKEEALYVHLQKIGKNIRMRNWRIGENWAILYYFPNEKRESDFKFSRISEESLGPIHIKES